MKRLIATIVATGILTMGWASTAVAGDAPEADEMVVVEFETTDVDEEVIDQFYGHLRNIVAEEDSLGIAAAGDVSMNDLLLIAGCETTEPDCLILVRDFVDGDQLLFGTIERSDDVHMFSLELFDFESQEIVRTVSEQTLRGDDAWLQEGIPAVVEHLVYGPTASVQIDVRGTSEAEVRLNGETVGTDSATVDDVAPGELVVQAIASDGTQQEERVIVRHDETRTVTLEFDPSVAGVDPGVGEPPSLIPGLAVTGAGVVGAIVGVIGQVQLSSADGEAATLVGDRDAIESDEVGHAQDLQRQMNSGNTMRIVGGLAGLAGLAGGGFLLFQALTAQPASGDTDLAGAYDERSFDIDVGASADGFNAGFRIRF